jgi:hypothetical protein
MQRVQRLSSVLELPVDCTGISTAEIAKTVPSSETLPGYRAVFGWGEVMRLENSGAGFASLRMWPI